MLLLPFKKLDSANVTNKRLMSEDDVYSVIIDSKVSNAFISDSACSFHMFFERKYIYQHLYSI